MAGVASEGVPGVPEEPGGAFVTGFTGETFVTLTRAIALSGAGAFTFSTSGAEFAVGT